jgi:hypothetical protein
MGGAVPPLPNTSSWRGGQLGEAQGQLYFTLLYFTLLILFGIRKNCHSSGSNLLLYLFIGRMIIEIVLITEGYN